MNDVNWLTSLPQAQQERVFGAMRRIGELAGDMAEIASRSNLPGGIIPVGGSDFDEILSCEVASYFLRCLRNGHSPQEASKASKSYSRELIQSHNLQRRDPNWIRWEGCGDTKIDSTLQIIIEALHD